MMVVYAVVVYSDFYPAADNVSRVFSSYERAQKYMTEMREKDKSDDNWEIFEYEVE
mgnify:CR=1 FL=1